MVPNQYPRISILAMMLNTADGISLEGNMLVTKLCTHPNLTSTYTFWMSDNRFSQIADGMPQQPSINVLKEMRCGDKLTARI